MKKDYSWTAWLLLIPLLTAIYCNKNNNEEPPGAVELRDTVIASGLSHPWEILWGPDDHIWISERAGHISRLNPETGVVQNLLTINEVVAQGEGGLLGMTLHPNFSSNSQLYVVYNYNSSNGYREKLVRFNYNTSGSSLTDPVTLLENIPASNIHNGSRLVIIGDKLFMSTGDAANTALAQNINSVAGKILRLNLDGTVPNDNPIPGNPYWSLGHRNAQGLVYANDKLYSSEHGPSNDDEINIIEKGRNYGWPDVHGFCDNGNETAFCNSENVAEPIRAWTPTVAACGLDYYNHDRIPQWKNSLLLATLKNQRLYQLKLNANGDAVESENQYYQGDYGRIRDVCISLEGRVYFATSNGSNDKIVMIDKE